MHPARLDEMATSDTHGSGSAILINLRLRLTMYRSMWPSYSPHQTRPWFSKLGGGLKCSAKAQHHGGVCTVPHGTIRKAEVKIYGLKFSFK